LARTLFALARASIHCAEQSKISLRALRASIAKRLALQLLREIAEAVAAKAADLPVLGLEVA
jgi:hypothetical protein